MKNQFTSRIVKFTFAFMFVLIASSCSEDNDVMDATVLEKDQINSEILAKGAKVSTLAAISPMVFSEPACVGIEHSFTINNTETGPSNGINIQYEVTSGVWLQLYQEAQAATAPTNFTFTFTEAGTYALRYKMDGSSGFVNGGSITVEDCGTCTESESSTAYAGNGDGYNAVGNNAWWYYLDIGDGLSNVTEDVWEGQSNDIGDVTYDSVTKIITITLDDWFLETGNIESVKWYSYATLPTDGRPTPGHATHKDTSLSFSAIQGDRYYVIHLDVATCE